MQNVLARILTVWLEWLKATITILISFKNKVKSVLSLYFLQVLVYLIRFGLVVCAHMQCFLVDITC